MRKRKAEEEESGEAKRLRMGGGKASLKKRRVPKGHHQGRALAGQVQHRCNMQVPRLDGGGASDGVTGDFMKSMHLEI